MAKRKYAQEPERHHDPAVDTKLAMSKCIAAWLVTINTVARYLDSHEETYGETGGARAIEDLYAGSEVMVAALRQHEELFDELDVEMPPGIGWYRLDMGGQVGVKSDDLPF